MSTPSTPSTPSERDVLNQRLVQELLAMRDALVQLSLCLKDWQFETDHQGRLAAQAEIDKVLNTVRVKPASCHTQRKS